MAPLPLLLVTGFLGAGKTTLMRRLIAQAKARGQRVAVVVNEWGANDVDGHILRQADAELLASIAGGCACCSGQDELRDTLLELALRPTVQRPHLVLLETSGLADPVLLLDVLTAPELLSRVQVARLLCVADAARWNELAALGLLLRRQLALADTVLLNKADLVKPEAMESIISKIQSLCEAQVLPSVQCEVPLDSLWPSTTVALPTATTTLPTRGIQSATAAHPHAHSVVVPVPHPIERAALATALEALPASVWRAKGFLRVRGAAGLQLLQYTGGGERSRWHLTPFRAQTESFFSSVPEPPLALVFIGAHLDEAQLRQSFGASQLLPMI